LSILLSLFLSKLQTLSLHRDPKHCLYTEFPNTVSTQSSQTLSLHRVPIHCLCTKFPNTVSTLSSQILSLHRLPKYCLYTEFPNSLYTEFPNTVNVCSLCRSVCAIRTDIRKCSHKQAFSFIWSYKLILTFRRKSLHLRWKDENYKVKLLKCSQNLNVSNLFVKTVLKCVQVNVLYCRPAEVYSYFVLQAGRSVLLFCTVGRPKCILILYCRPAEVYSCFVL
jgi:hypothetical protein